MRLLLILLAAMLALTAFGCKQTFDEEADDKTGNTTEQTEAEETGAWKEVKFIEYRSDGSIVFFSNTNTTYNADGSILNWSEHEWQYFENAPKK